MIPLVTASLFTFIAIESAQWAFIESTSTPTCPPETWCSVSLDVPDTAKAVYIAGDLIITPSSSDETCYLRAGFRTDLNAPTDLGYPQLKAMAVNRLNAPDVVREPWSRWVPLVDGHLVYRWGGEWLQENGTRLHGLQPWPEHCSMGFSARVMGWAE